MVVRDLLDWPFGSMLSLVLMTMVGAIFALGAMIAGADRITGIEQRE
jgi:putative spermidine/putrescine transport system permease protein